MKYRKTNADYRMDVSINNKGSQTSLILKLRNKDGLILIREQAYENTGLGLLLDEEFKDVIDQIVQDMESV